MKKFGVIVPSVLGLPWDLHALLPEGVQANIVTLNVRNGRPGEHERALGILRGATDVLIDEGAQAIVVAGVPVAARRGHAEERAGLAALTADRGAAPIVSSLNASVLAMQHLGVKRALLITQYNEAVNAQIVAYCRDAGLECAGSVGLGATNAAQVNALSTSDYSALARKSIERYAGADGIFLSARGNLYELTCELEASLGIPVIEQVQATVWWSLSRMDALPNAGERRLLSSRSATRVTPN